MKILTFALLLLGSTLLTAQQAPESQSKIATIFRTMELQGIDTKVPRLYGFFFFDKDRSKLEKLKDYLLGQQFRFVRLDKIEESKYLLHVEHVHVYTVTSLEAQDQKMRSIALKFKIDSYDGWDVSHIDPSKALGSIEEFKKSLSGKTPEAVFQTAAELYAMENYSMALIAYDLCAERQYKLDTCYFKSGYCHAELGDLPESIKKYQKALQLNPNYIKAQYNLGAAYYDNRQSEQSIEAYKQASVLNPTDARIYYGMAAAQYDLGKYKDAAVNCKKTLELDPEHQLAKDLLREIKKKN